MRTRTLLNSALTVLAVMLLTGAALACESASTFGTSSTTTTYSVTKTVVKDAITTYAFSRTDNMFRILRGDNSTPSVYSEIEIDEDAEMIDYDGDHVYILHLDEAGIYEQPNLTIIDVSNAADPTITFSGDFNLMSTHWERSRGFAVSNGFLWVMHANNILAYDVSDPTNPVRMGYMIGMSNGFEMKSYMLSIVGDYVYAAGRRWISDNHYDPIVYIYNLNPADGPNWAGDYLEPRHSMIISDLGDIKIEGILGSKGSDLFVSVSAIDYASQEFSSLVRYSCDSDGDLTWQSSVSDANDYTYDASSMAEEGNYLYMRTFPSLLRAFDIGDPGSTSEVASAEEFYGYVSIIPNHVFCSGKMTARICDTPSIPATGIRSYNTNGPIGGLSQTWNFEWYTDKWSDPSLDQVIVLNNTTGYDCDLGGNLQIFATNSRAEATVEYDPDSGRYLHHFEYWLDDCQSRCSYSWFGISFRAGNAAVAQGVLKIKFCFNSVTPPFDKSEDEIISMSTILSPPTPNPFNPQTTLRFHIPVGATRTSLTIHDVSGRVVRQLNVSSSNSGWNELIWNGRNEDGSLASSGVYFARLATDQNEAQVQKLVLLK